MKTSHFLLSLLFLAISFNSFSQSKEELEIRRLEKHWTELLDQGDTESLLKIWSHEYVVNNLKEIELDINSPLS